MGNRTYLIESDTWKPITHQGPIESALAAGKNCIPVYWYSLFDESCIGDNTTALDDGKTSDYPYLITSTSDARKRLSSRRGSFDRFSDRSSQEVTEKWFEFIEKIRRPFLHIETAELWMMMGSPNCQNHILSCLRAFDEAHNDTWAEILDASQIDIAALNTPIPAFKLAGFSLGGQPVPWK